MTAEIAALNLRGIALAADSAVTVNFPESPKVFHTAEKIFEVRSRPAMAMMVYGEASYLGVPWEVLVERLRKEAPADLDSAATCVVEVLDGFADRYSSADDGWYEDTVRAVFETILRRTLEAVDEEAAQPGSGKISRRRVHKLFQQEVCDLWEFMKDAAQVTRDADELEDAARKASKSQFSELRREVFRKYRVRPLDAQRLEDIATWAVTRMPRDSEGSAGVVLAGFGEDDVFPGIVELRIGGAQCGRAIVTEGRRQTVGPGGAGSMVVPFAQADAVRAFVEGHSPEFSALALGVISDVFERLVPGAIAEAGLRPSTKSRLEKPLAAARAEAGEVLRDTWVDLSERVHVVPLLETTSVAPVQELAQLAEWLVSLTSFKRRMTPGVESVGGPVDVCVLTRLGGFEWVKHDQLRLAGPASV